MAATRTQIYLTAEQRRRLDERGRSSGLGLAEMIRSAVDAYLGQERDLTLALDATFGAWPDAGAVSGEGRERGADPR
jgi:predicted DNA-binding protein